MNKFILAVCSLAMVMCVSVSISMAGTKPLDGLPDYNGTYYGTPNTGSLYDPITNRFTVLYRDNYNRTTITGDGDPCAGEGCGKHPGVDIRIPSGTSVKAAFTGIAVRVIDQDQCEGSTWGGLVVIEANNPYKAGEKVYVSYAHLSDVDTEVVLGSAVTEGQVIGKSGGLTSDPCSGSSTGAHLHFQVDRPHGDTYPWYPSGTTNSIPNVEYKDSDFGVTTKTYNPLPFIQGYG
ncbi:M23 family metallopeptidase, partial [Candidatus Parcubacteria bacterium]|nr:M23 family metallopeptidase [Candidatus Parcubacteria bacterium]